MILSFRKLVKNFHLTKTQLLRPNGFFYLHVITQRNIQKDYKSKTLLYNWYYIKANLGPIFF